MSSAPQPRRGNTRQRIQDVALELFSEHGYEKTSLREIAERLDVTKAALYYHFKTKEDIVISLFEDLGRPIDELIAWAQEQPRTLETKQEIIRRYHESLRSAEPLFRFMQENQATVRELTIGLRFKERMLTLYGLLKENDAELVDQVRCLTALFSMHAGMFAMQDMEGDPEEKREAILRVATELVTAANPPGRRPARPDSTQTASS
ncbi:MULTISPECIES: TetR/AcrR family transcriptional regulator [unclassified Streptomyces]|uniref:TetR/AcrR family transcriptional regulator n=1 Tax=unclassified Streptomyces TaxID=2593676 RepID=UPI000360FFFF|nr:MULTISPECIES: TetR/AcrR family transcriptional regulator [unclassified Streptomyces]MYT33504.1 TetR family transcriptional regulator [Streptomyces sp. SID8354]